MNQIKRSITQFSFRSDSSYCRLFSFSFSSQFSDMCTVYTAILILVKNVHTFLTFFVLFRLLFQINLQCVCPFFNCKLLVHSLIAKFVTAVSFIYTVYYTVYSYICITYCTTWLPNVYTYTRTHTIDIDRLLLHTICSIYTIQYMLNTSVDQLCQMF